MGSAVALLSVACSDSADPDDTSGASGSTTSSSSGAGGSGSTTSSSSSSAGGSTSSSSSTSSTSSTGSGGGGWGESEPGASAGPIDGFKAFRSGCGEQLWIRFIANDDFGLLEADADISGGGGFNIQYFEVPVFLKNEKSVYALDWDGGGYGTGTASFELTVAKEDNSKLTHQLEVPVEPLFRWPGQIDYADARIDDSDGLQITIDPKISGNVGRVFVYDSKECMVSWIALLEAVPISSGVQTEIGIGTFATKKGDDYLVVMQGVDDARDYIYYATFEMKGP